MSYINPLSGMNHTTFNALGHPDDSKLPYYAKYTGKNLAFSSTTYNINLLNPLTIKGIEKFAGTPRFKRKLSGEEIRYLRTKKKSAVDIAKLKEDALWKRISQLTILDKSVESKTPEEFKQLGQELLRMFEEQENAKATAVGRAESAKTSVCNIVTKYLQYCIRLIANEMVCTPDLRELCFTDPDKAFTRSQKLPLEKVLLFLLTMGGGSSGNEIYDYFKFEPSIPTVAGMTQRRGLLKPEGVLYFYHRITEICQQLLVDSSPAAIAGFASILGMDGSDINVAYDPNAETYVPGKKGCRGYNQYHLNGLYDILRKMFIGVVLQPNSKMHETKAAVEVISKMKFNEPALYTADRGYGSLNLLQHIIITKNLEALIRVKENWIKEIREMPLEEFDKELNLTIITTQTKEDKKRIANGEAKYLSGKNPEGKYKSSQAWDHDSETRMTFRVVRFKLSSGNWETLVTTLPREKYSLELLKELYHYRWGIEGAYRILKWDNHLAQMHCKKDDLAQQEIYARLAMFNLVSAAVRTAELSEDNAEGGADDQASVLQAMKKQMEDEGQVQESEQKNKEQEQDKQPEKSKKSHKYRMEINRHFATHAICSFFQCPISMTIDLGEVLLSHKVAVRPGRNYKRSMRGIGFAPFCYR